MNRMSSKGILIACVLVALVVVSSLVWLGAGSEPSSTREKAPGIAPQASSMGEERPGPEGADAARHAVDRVTSEAPGSAAGLGGTVSWKVSPEGSEPAPSGTMRISFVSGTNVRVVDVPIADGAWSIEAPEAPANLLVHTLQLDGRQARAVPPSIVVSDPNDVHVLAESTAPEVVQLFDRLTGRELEVARLVQVFTQSIQVGATLEVHPGPPTNRTRAFDRSAPVPVETLGDTASWFVGSPGYSWARLATRNRKASPSTLMLEPAGDLRVVLGTDSARPGVLKLWNVRSSDGRTPSYSLPITTATETAEFDGLVAGDYRATWQVEASKGGRPCELAEVPLQIVAGTISTMSLADLGRSPDPGLVEVAGSILVPNGSSEARVKQVVLEPFDVACTEPIQSAVVPPLLHSREGGVELVEWEPVRVLPGEYRVVVGPPQESIPVTIPSTTFFVVQIELPSLLEVDVEFVDRQTGERVPVDWFAFSCSSADPATQQRPLPFSRSLIHPTADRTRVELPRGTVRWTLSSPTHGYQHAFTQVREGGSLKVEIDRGRVIELTATAFGSPAELPVDLWNSLRVVNAQGESVVRTVTPLDAWTEGWSTRVAVTVEPSAAYTVELLGRECALEFDTQDGDVAAALDVTGAW